MPSKIERHAIPHTLYTDPELSQTGYTKKQAEERFGTNQITCLSWPLSKNDRAQTEDKTQGVINLIARRNGVIIGASILAPCAGEIIQTCTLAIKKQLKISDLASLIFPYPSYSEAIRHAAGTAYTDSLFSPKMQKFIKWRFKLLP